MKLLQSLRNIFSSNINQNHDDNSKDIPENAVLHISKNYSLSVVSDKEYSDYIWLLGHRD